ncbi:MAG: hypothetical protein CVU89_10515 [Firmicutes bacterium HGW-Firmicutes-14]|jgi:AcrR family transcriptional regulator|nr:MAG: hypothetical protein CVU89_10515 [Firmicutes bacterium HGW-Firmicutes-14]
MTKDNIKREALSLFVKKGYEGTSVSDIAKKANIRASSIYFHYESKEQLFLSLFQDIVNEKLDYLEELRNKTADKGIKNLLQNYLDNHLKQIETNRDRLVFYKRNAMFPPENLKETTRKILISYEEEYVKLLTPAFHDGIRQGILKNEKINKLLNAFQCVADGLYVLSHYYEINIYKKIVDEVWDLFWKSIKSDN